MPAGHAPHCPTGGGVMTVSAALPVTPSLRAVIVADPVVTPVASPLALTVATPVLLLDHVTSRPLSWLPAASFRMGVNWKVPFTATLAASGLTVTNATGASCTVIVAVPFVPSLVAVIVAPPAAFVATVNTSGLVAAMALLVAHVTVRPLNALPPASLGVAVSWTVPATRRLADVGVTSTDATGAGALVTVMADVPLCPSLVAVIVAEPTVAPLTSPVMFTVATAGLLVAHAIARPPSALPLASRGVAVNWTV